MKFVTSEAMRKAEARAIAKDNTLAVGMMDRAGKGLARTIQDVAFQLGRPQSAVRLLAGPGNNGGDAFVAAMYLREVGLAPEVWLTCPKEKLRGAAKICFEQMAADQTIAWREMVGEAAWRKEAEASLAPLILVDALLGTGAKGTPMGDVRRAVEYLNSKRPFSLIVAADLPTGMDADTGSVAEPAVQADFTVTMCMPKIGMTTPEAREQLGTLVLIPVGIPREFVDAMPDARSDLQMIASMDVRQTLAPRRRDSHKGTYGTALLLGGSARYPGAIVLAAESAVRSGAGRVRVHTVPDAVAPLVARVPEAIVEPNLGPDLALAGAEAALIGPGLGRDPEARRLVAKLLHEAPGPLVLDADAIAVLAGKPEVVKSCAHPVVLTPHPGELGLLLGRDAASIQQDRLGAVREAAECTGAVVVLKGAGTLVAQAGQPTWINLNGNPGMACGGSGDVLAGLLVGLLAQKIPPLAAACAATWLHGAAGDVAALRTTQIAMKAGDVVQALPTAFRMVTVR